MSDNSMTIYGNLGTQVDLRESGAFAWAMFRVGSTPRYFDRLQGTWKDLETVWVTVKATKVLAHNAAKSLKIGDPVVVVGRLRSHTWADKETGEVRRRDVLEATTVAHDLNRGTTTFTRNEPAPSSEPTTSTGEAVAAFENDHQVSGTPGRAGVSSSPAGETPSSAGASPSSAGASSSSAGAFTPPRRDPATV